MIFFAETIFKVSWKKVAVWTRKQNFTFTINFGVHWTFVCFFILLLSFFSCASLLALHVYWFYCLFNKLLCAIPNSFHLIFRQNNFLLEMIMWRRQRSIESLGIFSASGDTFTPFNTWQIKWYANFILNSIRTNLLHSQSIPSTEEKKMFFPKFDNRISFVSIIEISI